MTASDREETQTANRPVALTSEAFFLQLHAKRYDQFIGFALMLAKSALSLNGGGIAILLTATVFASEGGLSYPITSALAYCGGLLCALSALSLMYLFSTRVLGDFETYRPLVPDAPYSRLKSQGYLLKTANFLLFVSIVLFFAGTITAAFSVTAAP